MRFRKSFKLAKGVRVNVTSKGVSSVSLGGKGATLNVGEKGVRSTVGIPGTGISHSEMLTANDGTPATAEHIEGPKKIGVLLGAGIVLMPYFFAWFTLRKGYSMNARFISFAWMAGLIYYVSTTGQ